MKYVLLTKIQIYTHIHSYTTIHTYKYKFTTNKQQKQQI